MFVLEERPAEVQHPWSTFLARRTPVDRGQPARRRRSTVSTSTDESDASSRQGSGGRQGAAERLERRRAEDDLAEMSGVVGDGRRDRPHLQEMLDDDDDDDEGSDGDDGEDYTCGHRDFL